MHNKEHITQFRSCMEEEVYVVPLSCRAEYIFKTCHCTNNHLRGHRNDAKPSSECPTNPIAVWAKSCIRFAPGFGGTYIMEGHHHAMDMKLLRLTSSAVQHFIDISILVKTGNGFPKTQTWHTSSWEQSLTPLHSLPPTRPLSIADSPPSPLA